MNARATCVLAALVLVLGCNISDEEIVLTGDDAGHTGSDTGWVTEEDSGELDTSPPPDAGNDLPDTRPEPPPPSGMVIRQARMETLDRDLQSGALRIHSHSIEGPHRICDSNNCISGRIEP